MRRSPNVLAVTAALGMYVIWAGCSRNSGPTALDEGSRDAVTATLSDISSDEEVVFFPTSAHLDEASHEWIVPIHGSIYEPERDSTKRTVIVTSLSRALGVEAGTPEAQRLEQRARLFLVDNERGKKMSIRLGEELYQVGVSGPNGHFQAELRIAATRIERLRSSQQSTDGVLWYSAVTQETDQRSFTGRTQIVPPQGLSIISDIDDTIKHSQVGDRTAVLANTFLREFQPVPGMPELYRGWAGQGIVFHYVSGSPWQLYLPLAEFFSVQQLPTGSVDLKYFRLKDPSALGLLQSQEDTKRRAIEPILQAFPQRRFVLIGDSGEQDPEIYTRIARTHRQQIEAIFIRNVTQEQADSARISALRQGLDNVRFQLFDSPAELRPIVEEIRRAQAASR
jgi:hypothetical protein